MLAAMKPSNVRFTIFISSLGVDVEFRSETLNAVMEMQTSTNAHSEQLHPQLQEAADYSAHCAKSVYADELKIGST